MSHNDSHRFSTSDVFDNKSIIFTQVTAARSQFCCMYILCNVYTESAESVSMAAIKDLSPVFYRAALPVLIRLSAESGPAKRSHMQCMTCVLSSNHTNAACSPCL